MINRLAIITLGICALFVVGCEDDGPDLDIEASIPVRVDSVALKPIMEFAFATGTVKAVKEATLSAQQPGYYRLLNNPRTGKAFAMGDEVKTGEMIVRLVNQEFENQIGFESKKLNFDISEREFIKQKSLYEKGGITQRELIDSERSFIDARYGLDNAKLSLDKLKIKSPFNGIIVDLPFYSANQLVESNALIVQVMDYSRLYTEVTLPGKEMERVKRNQEALITNYAHPEDTLNGFVSQVSPALDPESRMFKLGIEINNDSLLLRPGMFVKADIIVDSRDSTLVIPKDIILERRGNKTVFVVEAGVAQERILRLGLSNQKEVEVLDGLEHNDRLVVEGFETLRPRSKVKITK